MNIQCIAERLYMWSRYWQICVSFIPQNSVFFLQHV